MASPLNVFRKHRKALIVVIGIICMIAFVIFPVMLDTATTSRQRNEVVVTTKYGKIREADLDGMIRNRQIANLFLDEMLARTVGVLRQEGQLGPMSDFQVLERLRLVLQNQGLLQPPTEASVIEYMVLARKAEELGIIISDDEINRFIAQQTGDKLSADQLRTIVERLRISQRQLFNVLRTELLASRLRGMFEDALEGMTPAERWENYLRFKQQATIEAVPIPVAEFTNQVGEPDEATLVAFYESYKENVASPLSPEPGFHEPQRARFQYFKADYETLMAEATVSDEEVKEFYEENKDTYFRYPLPSTPPMFHQPAADEPVDQTGLPAGDEAAMDEPTTDQPAITEPQADSATEPEGPVFLPPSSPQDEGAAPSVDETDPRPAESPDSDELSNSGDMTQTEAESADSSRDSAADTADEKPADAATNDEPADDASNTAAESAAPAESATEESTTDRAATDETTSAVPAMEPDATGATDADASDLADLPDPEYTLPDQWVLPLSIRDLPAWDYLPLWMVDDRIRTELERRKTVERVTEVFDELSEAMNQYAAQWVDWEDAVADGADVPQPKPLDFTKLAEGKPVTPHETGLLTVQEAVDTTDIAQSFIRGSERFPQVAFGDRVRQFVPMQSEDLEGNRYLFWKIEQAEDRIPSFAEIRDKVLDQWKLEKARHLAREAAQKLADQASAGDDSLAQIASHGGRPLIEAGPFTWLTYGSADPLSFQRTLPRISEVEGVTAPGSDFMRRVFTLEEGEIGVAMNEPQSIAYIVRLKATDPAREVLQATFMADNYRRYATGSIYEQRETFLAWLKQIEDEAGVHWVRRPDTQVQR